MRKRQLVLRGVALVWLLAGCDPRPVPPVPDAGPAFCGGIAGFPCPAPLVCVDDPRDDCHPGAGGADCGGICVNADPACAARYADPARRYLVFSAEACKAVKFACKANERAFFDPCGCGCERQGADAGETCRTADGAPVATCASGLTCCYPCGIPGCAWQCTPPCAPGSPACHDGCQLRP